MAGIVRQFKFTFIFSTVVVGGMVYFAQFAPRGWEINTVTVIVPVALQIGGHFLIPFVFAIF
jgi:thiamine transporter ThiT